MLTTKFAFAAALATALVFGATLSASAASNAAMARSVQNAADNVISGYGKDGSRVAVPNPDR
ncbi:MAG: hypothetical protein WBE90_04590 [Xanthobacteraceae bacterium]